MRPVVVLLLKQRRAMLSLRTQYRTSLIIKILLFLIALFVGIQILVAFQLVRRPFWSHISGKTSCKDQFSSTQIQCHANFNNVKGTPVAGVSRHAYKLYKPSCKDLISGDESEVERAVVYGIKYRPKHINMFRRNCTHLKKDCIFKVTNEESSFPLAYSIVMHKNMQQFNRLLMAIYRPSNLYCIHVHANASHSVMPMLHFYHDCLPNVFVSSSRLDIRQGEFSVLKADLGCMEDLLEHNGWKYFINLAGKEFPLKTNLEIIRILKIQNGTNLVDINGKSQWASEGSPPHDITLYTGEESVAVTRDFVKYVINDPVSKDFLKWIHKAKVPYEVFFSTISNNAHLKVPGSSAADIDYIIKKPLIVRFQNFRPISGRSMRCRGVRKSGFCVFGVGDLPLLVARRELFANKLEVLFQPQTFECLEEWFQNRTEFIYRKERMNV